MIGIPSRTEAMNGMQQYWLLTLQTATISLWVIPLAISA